MKVLITANTGHFTIVNTADKLMLADLVEHGLLFSDKVTIEKVNEDQQENGTQEGTRV